ncbi:MAG: ATP-binding response regulator, partial [Anaerolineales bacterium]
QNEEKEKRAAELVVANKELAFQNKEKEKRAAELVIANNELKKAEADIGKLNEELEQRVIERTTQFNVAKLEAERANKAKSEFLSRMSHELRTPMNSILGFTQLLQMDELNPDQAGSLEQILKSGHHLLNLINEVLDISRIESGKMAISPEPVQLHQAIKSAVELIRPLADIRGILIHIKIPSSQDVFVTADRQRLKQVLLNLLSNAVKYNRENGEVEIAASLLVDGFLHLTVRDTGEGIQPEKMERLFVAFDRLELDPDLVEGTGLGLALSKGLVEAMGGRIGAQSVVGEGTTFWFDLRLTTQQKELIVMSEVDDFLKGSPSLEKGLVLYVEDNLPNIQLIEKILARLPNVELISTMQGRLAMDLARMHKPALILLDLHLPDIHGEVVLERLRAEPETKHIPIVIMSADATTDQIEHMLAVGANAYLTKPIDVKEFLKMVGEMLGS